MTTTTTTTTTKLHNAAEGTTVVIHDGIYRCYYRGLLQAENRSMRPVNLRRLVKSLRKAGYANA